jgi:hypothetical protein
MATSSPIFNYALYANFNREISDQIVHARSTMWETCPDLISSVSLEHPHMTVIYGPMLAPDKKEITTFDKDMIEEIYPGLLSSNFQMPFFYTYRGVSHFKRGNRYIIKMEFASIPLTNLQMHLRRALPQVDATYLTAHKSDGDNSRASNPERWLHVSLCEVLDVNNVPVVEEAARNALQYFPTLVEAHNLSVISAVTNTSILLPFTKHESFKPMTKGHLAVHISDLLEVTTDESFIGLYNMNVQLSANTPIKSTLDPSSEYAKMITAQLNVERRHFSSASSASSAALSASSAASSASTLSENLRQKNHNYEDLDEDLDNEPEDFDD